MKKLAKSTWGFLVAALLIPNTAAHAATDQGETIAAGLDQQLDYVAGAEVATIPTGAVSLLYPQFASADAVVDGSPVDTHRVHELTPRISDDNMLFVGENLSLMVLAPAEAEASASDVQLLAASITCTLNVQNVRGSTHVAGTINGIASINCTRAAGSLQIHYSMIRLSPYAQWAGPSRTNGGLSSISTNRAISC